MNAVVIQAANAYLALLKKTSDMMPDELLGQAIDALEECSAGAVIFLAAYGNKAMDDLAMGERKLKALRIVKDLRKELADL